MSILRIIQCNIPGCNHSAQEATPNAGWPGWGVLQGRANEHGEMDFHLCPEHLDKTFKLLMEDK